MEFDDEQLIYRRKSNLHKNTFTCKIGWGSGTFGIVILGSSLKS
jgi:hypothetical protein